MDSRGDPGGTKSAVVTWTRDVREGSVASRPSCRDGRRRLAPPRGSRASKSSLGRYRPLRTWGLGTDSETSDPTHPTPLRPGTSGGRETLSRPTGSDTKHKCVRGVTPHRELLSRDSEWVTLSLRLPVSWPMKNMHSVLLDSRPGLPPAREPREVKSCLLVWTTTRRHVVLDPLAL